MMEKRKRGVVGLNRERREVGSVEDLMESWSGEGKMKV